MKIMNGKDFWAGLMFLGFGIGYLLLSMGPPAFLVELVEKQFDYKLAFGYPMGTAVRMGPAYFPTMLGGILAVLGGVILFRAFVSKISNSLAVFPFRFWLVVVGLVLAVAVYYVQPPRDASIVLQAGHLFLAGVSIALLFAAFGPRPLWVILVAVVVFGYLLKPLGLVPAIFVLTVVSAVPGFAWTRKDSQVLPVYLVVALILTFLTLLVAPWIQRAAVGVLGTIGVHVNPTLTLIFTEIGLSAALAILAGRYKWPQVTASQITILSYILAVFSVASFVHGLGLPMNVWPSLWE